MCILINPFEQPKVDYSYANESGRIVLITITFNGQKLSLCNIYAPNDQVNQFQFMQELNNCIIDKSELTSPMSGETGIVLYQKKIRSEVHRGDRLITVISF